MLARYGHVEVDHDYNDIDRLDIDKFGAMRRGGHQLPYAHAGGQNVDSNPGGSSKLLSNGHGHLADIILNVNESERLPLAEPDLRIKSDGDTLKTCRNSVQGKVSAISNNK